LKCGVDAKVMFFDTEVHSTIKLTKHSSVKECGRGGTDFKDFFDKAAKQRPDAMVVFSDMDAPDNVSVADLKKVPVLWVFVNGDRSGGIWNSYGYKVLLD
jgi:predicted metal-dependent peptidase